MDKLWSLLPITYAWHFATHDLVSGTAAALDPRLLLLAVLITVWGVRLTYNFARKGGYRWQDEDYRCASRGVCALAGVCVCVCVCVDL